MLFLDFVRKAQTTILNLDDEETSLLAVHVQPGKRVTFGFNPAADLHGSNVEEAPLGISFDATDRKSGETVRVRLGVPGRHNASNALAALAAARASGIQLAQAAEALAGFTGLRRRFDVIGTRNDISVIDDFGHNPDKIAATLDTLHAFPGRLLVFFQPHGYGPLRTLRDPLIGTFADKLGPEDILILPDPAYYGGTVERTVGSEDIIAGVRAAGRAAEHVPERAAAGERLLALARPGDRIIIMGARDDTLSQFAADLLERL
jgi:UDP-N-acetylmuramate--alanine ligase